MYTENPSEKWVEVQSTEASASGQACFLGGDGRNGLFSLSKLHPK